MNRVFRRMKIVQIMNKEEYSLVPLGLSSFFSTTSIYYAIDSLSEYGLRSSSVFLSIHFIQRQSILAKGAHLNTAAILFVINPIIILIIIIRQVIGIFGRTVIISKGGIGKACRDLAVFSAGRIDRVALSATTNEHERIECQANDGNGQWMRLDLDADMTPELTIPCAAGCAAWGEKEGLIR